MAADALRFARGTRELCPGLDGGNRLSAIADFAYNLGLDRLKHSTLRRRLNAGEIEDAKDELRKWVYGGGKKLRGLILRRDAEAKLL